MKVLCTRRNKPGMYPAYRLLVALLLLLGLQHLARAQCPAGSITLTTQAQVDNFTVTYPGCTHVLGSLIIGPSADIADLNGLSGVTQIDGSLVISGNAVLTDATGLGGLTSIGTSIDIQNNPVLGAIDLSGVSAVNVTLFNVQNNATLSSALLPTDVQTIAQHLQYSNNPLLTSISEMNSLTSAGQLVIDHVLANILPAFSALTAIGNGGLYLANNPNITAIPAFPNLISVGGQITIQANQNLTDFDLSAISTHDIVSMQARDNPALTSALFPTDVTAISQYLQYYNNPLLTSISEMNSLTTIGGYLSINHVLVNTFPVFSSLTDIGSGLYLGYNPNITAIPAFPNLNSIGGTIDIRNNQNLTDFDLSGISTHDIIAMVVRDNPALTSALLPTDVTAVAMHLQYYNNPLLAAISEMNNLTTIGDYLSINHVLANTLPAFSSLTSINNALYLGYNPNITAIPAFPSLTSIGGAIDIRNNQNLTDFDLSSVSTHDIREMLVHSNPSLIKALLPTDVSAISRYLIYDDNPLLEEVSTMNNLTTIGDALSFTVTNACRLPDFPSLITIGTRMIYSDNPRLTVIPKLAPGAVINDNVHITNNPSLGYCAIQAVCDFLQGPGVRNISNNAGACLDEAAVTASCLANDPHPDFTPTLDPASETIVQQNDQATLILANLQPGQTAVWYAEDQSTVLYNDAANNFQPVVNQSAIYYAAVQNTGNGCTGPLLAVPVFSYPALSLQTSYSFTCSNSATGVATVYARGGAQSIGQGNFVVSDEWLSIFGPETAYAAEAGDLNGDGYLDLLTYDAGSPDIWLNDGDGTFTNGFQNFLINISTQCVGFIKLGDFDGDGDLDALRLFCEGLRLWWNDGAGHFSPDATVYQANHLGPSQADVGDVDLDGDLDFIIRNNSGIQVFYNNGSGSFTMGGETYVDGGITYVYLRDFDNDGYPDILAVALAAAHPMRVLLNDGDGTFTLNGSYGTGNRSQADFGYFNADAYLDFVVKGHLTTPAKVFLNDGDGSFTEQAADYGGTVNGDVKVGDFNQDGNADFFLSLAIAPNNYPATYFGNGDGTFTLHENFLDVFINSGTVAGIALADFDMDGDLDIYGGNKIYKNDQSRVDPYDYAWSNGHTTPSASNLPPGTYTVTVTDNAGQTASATVVVNAPPDVQAQVSATPVSCTNAKNGTASALGSGGAPFIFKQVDENYATYGAGSQVIRLGHFNADGYLDILSVGGGPGNGNYPYVTDHLFFGDGDGTFTESLPAFDVFDTSFGEPADLDGDNDLDILNSGYLRIFGRFNDGAGNFTSGPAFNFPIGNIVGQAWHIGPTGDFDGDGDQDIFAFGFNYMVHVVLLNNGDGTYTQSPTIYGLEMIRRVAVGDLDGDGYDDIFIPGYGLPCFVYRSNGDGTFTQMPQSYGGQQMWGDVDLADLDGDGDLDAFAASFGNTGPQNGPGNLVPSLYKVFLNNGDATFTEHATILEEVYFTELITLGDADGDGDIDAFSGGRQSFGIVWLNDGNANFSKYPFKTAGGWHWDARWGDLDNDGDQDLVVGDGTAKVLLNQENCYTYKWNTGATTADISGLNPGNYTVTVTDYGGCTVVETVAVGNANYQPPVAANSNAPLCTGTGDLQLSESGGEAVSWSWTGPSGFQSTDQNPVRANPTPAHSGNYTVVITDANGCTGSQTISVTVFDIPQINCPADLSVCLSDVPLDLDALGATPGGGSFSGNGVSGNTYNAAAGTTNIITYTVTDANNCSNSCTFQITANSLPQVGCTGNQVLCSAELPLDLSALGASPGGGVFSGTGVNGTDFNAPGGNTYMVSYTMTDLNNCTNTCTFNVQVKTTPACTISNDMDMACPFSTNNHYEAPAGMDSYIWSVIGNGAPTTPLNGQAIDVTAGASGSYTVALTVYKNGCSATCSKMIHIDVSAFSITGAAYCTGDPGPVIGLSGSDMGVSYQLQTGGGSNLGAPVTGTGAPIQFGAYPNGQYQVVVTADGCTQTITGTIAATIVNCNIAVPNFCTCNAPDGRAGVTVKISAPSGQNWTVKAMTGLYAATSPPAPAAPVPMPVGTPLTDIGGNMYTLDGIRKTDKGYWVQVTNGSTDFDVMVGNAAW